MEDLTMSTSRQPTPWWLSKCKKRVLAPLTSFRRCHSNWKPQNLKQMHLWRYLGHEYQRFLGMLHRTPLCGQMSLRDSCRFLQCPLCPDITGKVSIGHAQVDGETRVFSITSEEQSNFGVDKYEHRKIVNFRASYSNSMYGRSSAVNVPSAYALIIIKQ